MGAILRSELTEWYTKLNNGRAKIGLAAVNPDPSSLLTTSSSILGQTGKTLKSQIDALQLEYNFTGTAKCTLNNSEFESDIIRASLKAKIDTVMASIDSVNVAQVSYVQSANNNGTNSNGSCTQGVRLATTKSYGSNSDGYKLNGYKGNTADNSYGTNYNGANSNGTRSYGTNADGQYSPNGTNSNGTNANGCTETSNTRETTYTNT